ncbi:MAG TPA: electron transfer flavoprotein subunit alpha/FixB family protein [Syntrophorhabdaceae bacterium]|nr:electron transfer flavoprotein subunit alpha/FixB family protein [Syntrophorhabdaceae bacterium]
MDKVLVFVEIKGDGPRKVSLELLCEAARFAQNGRFSVEAVCIGRLPDAARDKLLSYTEKLVHFTDPELAVYSPEGYARALAGYAREGGAKMVIAGATGIGRDFLPRVAVLLETGIASDVTGANWLNEPMTFVRPMFGGKVFAEVVFSTSPVILTVRPNSFAMGEAQEKGGEYIEKTAGISPDTIHTKVVRVEEASRDTVDLTEADLIVAGGRGLKAAENFNLIEELAGAIGATVGATRSVVDAKWREQADQIGKSGKTVSPKLYIGAGISGAIHHIMGMDTSKVVLAINRDPNAIIFNYANYGIVGDLFEVLPAMTQELKKRKEG